MDKSSPSHTRGAEAPPGFFRSRARLTAPVLTRVFLAASIALTVSRTCLGANDEPVENFTVTGRPIRAPERKAPTSFVTVIDTEQRAEEFDTAADLLAESVGVQVRRFGGLGAFSTISIRGSTSNQVRFYLDGIPLSRARNETVNLADLPIDSLEQIDVYRGSIPVGFGAGGIAGVVNFVTKESEARAATDLSASYGSFETRRVSATHTGTVHGLDLLAHLTYFGTDGNFSFLDDHGTEFQPADDRKTDRINNNINSLEGLFKAGYSFSDGTDVDLTSEFFFKDAGIPGPDFPQAERPSLGEWRSLNYLRFHNAILPVSGLDLSGTIFGVYEHSHFEDPAGELGAGNVDRIDASSTAGGNTAGTYEVVAGQAVGWFGELRYERFATSDENPKSTQPDPPAQTRLHATLALQHQAELLGGRVLAVPTIRYEHVRDRTTRSDLPANPLGGGRHTIDRDLWSPSIGIQVPVRSWLLLKGNLGMFERPPNFSELFGSRGNERGNPSLGTEKGINRDIGLVAAFGGGGGWLDRARIEYVYFNNDFTDLIVFEFTGFKDFRPFNIGAARVQGHELNLQAGFLGHFNLTGNYTHFDAEDRGERPSSRGKQLPNRPADEAFLRLDAFVDRAKVYYEFNVVSGNFLDRVNFNEARSRDTHALGITVAPFPRLSLNFEARNLTDNDIRDVGDFPLPGRSFFGTVKLGL